MSTLRNKPQIIRLIHLGEMVQNNQKTGFCTVFSHFGAIWAPPDGPKKVLKGPQVGGRFGPMSKLRNMPVTKLLGPFFWEKWSKTTKTGFYAVF
jgi:hypothetical protein